MDLYVSGLLSIEEMRDVELKACQHAEIKTELESLQSAFERFAMNHAMAPRPELKKRIMMAIEEEEKAIEKKKECNSLAESISKFPTKGYLDE